MPEEPDYILDIGSLPELTRPDRPKAPAEAPDGNPNPAMNWIGIRFDCCGVYTRIYRNRDGTAYEGACPRCARPVHIAIGPGGTNHRLFRAS